MADSSLVVTASNDEVPKQEQFHFAEFIFSTNGPVLIKNEQEVPVEPQVLELLYFLIKNSNRYILTEELHNEVWKGRVVSDAAVRRAISKLRACLGQNESGEPYIKSAHKRGYKFSANIQKVEQQQKKHSKSKTLLSNTPFLIIGTVLLIVIMVLVLNRSVEQFIQSSTAKVTQSSEFIPSPILSFHGEKTDLTKSDDGQWLAFAGKNVGFQGFQLFLSNLNEQVTKQLTINEDNVIRVEFSRNNQRLYYINLSIGNASLSTISFDETLQVKDKQSLVSGYYFISDFALTPDESGLYFTGIKEKSANSQVFYLDLNTLAIKEITSGYQNESHDYRISMSTDGANIAIVSVVGEIEQKISLIDTTIHKVKQRFFHESPLLAVEWLSNNELLLLDRSALVKLNIETGHRTVVNKPDNLTLNSIDITPTGEVVALTEGDKNNFFVEVDFPSMQLSSKKVLTGIADNIAQAMFAGNDSSYMLLNKEKNAFKLIRQDAISGVKTTLFSSTLPINIQSVSSDGEQVLMFLDGLLAIFHTNEQKLEYIHNGDRLLSAEARFSSSGKEVMFGERTNEGWTIKIADLLTGKQRTLVDGFYSALEYKNGYLLRDENGKVYIQRDELSEIEFLGIEIMIDKRTTWTVRGDVLYWSIHDGITAQFFAKNLISGKDYSLNFDSSLVSSNFDLNLAGEKAILQSQQLPNSQVVSVSINN